MVGHVAGSAEDRRARGAGGEVRARVDLVLVKQPGIDVVLVLRIGHAPPRTHRPRSGEHRAHRVRIAVRQGVGAPSKSSRSPGMRTANTETTTRPSREATSSQSGQVASALRRIAATRSSCCHSSTAQLTRATLNATEAN